MCHRLGSRELGDEEPFSRELLEGCVEVESLCPWKPKKIDVTSVELIDFSIVSPFVKKLIMLTQELIVCLLSRVCHLFIT